MKRTRQHNSRGIAIGLGAIVSAIGLAACSPQDDGQTAGQKLDRAIASADRSTDQAADDARAAGRDLGRATAEGVDKASDKVRDAAITTEINAKLAMDTQLSATQIDVDTVGGRVVLRGTAPDPQARENATRIAMAVDGVRGVDNQLVVSGQT
jgi:osmotically-inducible protein OsmY